jgi:hypothetical protein
MAAVSTGAVYSSTDLLRRPWVNPTTIAAGTAVISSSDQPGIAITGTGDSTAASLVVGPYTVTQAAGSGGGVGNEGKEFSAAVDGTWTFPVTGGLTSTPNNTLVYAVVSSGDITSLTLTVGSNKKYGVVDYPKDYVKTAGFLPVKIGVFA